MNSYIKELIIKQFGQRTYDEAVQKAKERAEFDKAVDIKVKDAYQEWVRNQNRTRDILRQMMKNFIKK